MDLSLVQWQRVEGYSRWCRLERQSGRRDGSMLTVITISSLIYDVQFMCCHIIYTHHLRRLKFKPASDGSSLQLHQRRDNVVRLRTIRERNVTLLSRLFFILNLSLSGLFCRCRSLNTLKRKLKNRLF